MMQYGVIEDTLYFWFAANDTSGSGGDGATPLAKIRLAGAVASVAPVLSPTPVLLSHANYPAGCYEVAIAATAANGFAANNIYAVFCSLAIDSQNPTGFVGAFSLKPVIANLTQIGGGAQSATDLKDFADEGYDPVTKKVQGISKLEDLLSGKMLWNAAQSRFEIYNQSDVLKYYLHVRDKDGSNVVMTGNGPVQRNVKVEAV